MIFLVRDDTIAREGRKNLAIIKLYTIPITTKIRPTLVNSKILNDP